MRVFGSLTNRLMEGGRQPLPMIGDGATVCLWSDRHACTVIEVQFEHKRGPWIVLQEDTARRTDANGMSDCQTYAYEPNPEGRKYFFTLAKDGWRRVDPYTGRLARKGDSLGLLLGQRHEYHDFSF